MKTLIIVDMQHDFMPGGALPVARANEIIPVINRILPKFDHVIAVIDWHPRAHVSFASAHRRQVGEVIEVEGNRQVLWPDHCIQETRGAHLAHGLEKGAIEEIFHKGSDPKIDSYSVFFDNVGKRETGLRAYLKKWGLTDLYFVGVATDYCILYSVLDALKLGFKATVIQAACRAICLNPDDEANAFDAMARAGATLLKSF